MAVNAVHRDYDRMKGKWKRCRDAYAGEDAVHEAGIDYLPRLKDQVEDDYQAYVKRTPFYNATYRTLSGMVGMLYRVPPKMIIPEGIEELLKDVTLSGVTFQVMAQDVASDALLIGRCGILVDYPQVESQGFTTPTLLDAQRMNARPTMQFYCTESIINWKTRRINNAIVVTMVVLKEEEHIDQDEFTDKIEERFRVLDLENGVYRVRMMKRETDRDVELSVTYPLMNGKPLDFIPFVFIGSDNLEAEVDDPPFIDLVNMNFSHYRTMADYEHGAHFTGLPTPYIAGWQPQQTQPGVPPSKMYIGSSHAWTFPDPQTNVGYLEFSGQGLETLEKILERKERQMAILGARMLEAQKDSVEAADTQAQRRKGEESLMSQVAQTVSQGLERALTWFVAWAGKTGEVILELNRDFFPTRMQPAEIQAMVSAWQQNAISYTTLFDNLKRGEVIPEERDQEEEESLIAEQQLALVRMQKEVNEEMGLNPDGTPKESPPPEAPPAE